MFCFIHIKLKNLMNKEIRLNSYIAKYSNISRRKADDLIVANKVKVNGRICNVLGKKVVAKDTITIANNVIKPREGHEITAWAFNKPVGVVCSNKRQKNEKLVKDFFDTNNKLVICGRLDKDSCGLLIVTNDGSLANEIIHPSKNATKEYIIQTKEDLTNQDIKNIKSGCEIEGKEVVPVAVKKLKSFKTAIEISEGKNREIRKIYEKFNLNIISLKRIRIGGIMLGKLKPGEHKSISQKTLDFYKEGAKKS